MYSGRVFNKRRKFKQPTKIVFFGLLMFLIFLVGLCYFRFDEWQGNKEVITKTASETPNPVFSEIDPLTMSKEAIIKSSDSNVEVGRATRGVENQVFYFSIKADLPTIDREKEFYEGWLIRQKPYDFISVGEMTTNNLGQFVLEWAGDVNNLPYFSKVVITREAKDGNAAPSTIKAGEGIFE